MKVIYLFAGKRRHSDVGSFLRKLADAGRIELQLHEIDIERSQEHDLRRQDLWDDIHSKLEQGGWFLIVSPPCNTFSRARFQWRKYPGPRPLRNRTWPKGFPWLSNDNARIVEEANEFILQCIKACTAAVHSGGWYFWEHPEDLGLVQDEVPGSVWQWTEIHELLSSSSGCSFAVHQCHFGALTPKPTRFMCNFKVSDKRCYFGLPKFDCRFKYLGPLPAACGHKHVHKLMGKTANRWNTSPSASYPEGLCQFIADAIVFVFTTYGGGGTSGVKATVARAVLDKTDMDKRGDTEGNKGPDVVAVQVDSESDADLQQPSQSRMTDQQAQAAESSTSRQGSQVGAVITGGDDTFDVRACMNRGHPIVVEWDGRERDFIDGFGLCSPTRWHPSARGTRRSTRMRKLATDTFALLMETVNRCIPDVRAEAFRLATGKIAESPFPPDVLDKLRVRWAELLPDPKLALQVAEGQPFFLHGLAQWLEVFEDPDVGSLVDVEDSFATGVPVGVLEPLPRTPQVFHPKLKHKKLDESEYNPVAVNYPSAKVSAAELEKKFLEEEALGRMFPMRLAVAKERFGEDKVRVAAMAAITKPDGSVRPLHDGTHSVQVNNAIVYRDQIQCPGPPEVAAAVRETLETREAPFALSADIRAAHRLVKIRPADWGFLACRADSDSQTVWINKCGTFGISSAPYWWAKLFALVGRFVGHVMATIWFMHMVYVDDLHGAFIGERKFHNLWVWVLAFELVGTPFGYHKFRGGFAVEFVGFQMRYDSKEIGITIRRGDWLRDWIISAEEKRYVVVTRDFSEFLGRLGFVAQLLVWMKPHLSPLYAWSAATGSSTVAKLPDTVILTLKYILAELRIESYLVSAARPQQCSGERFRTDAKCTDDSVVLGGWEISTGRWFQVKITQDEAPYLFRDGKGAQWASTSAELLASMAALVAFGWAKPVRERKTVELCLFAGTDNRSNEFLSDKRTTTKWPLMLINLQLSSLLSRARLSLKLRWRPREHNTVADDITNSEFAQVDMAKQIHMSYADLPTEIIHTLWDTKSEFDRLRLQSRAEAPPGGKKRKRHDKTPW